MSRRPRVLFVHNAPITFVTQDLELLRERYDVTELHVRSDYENPLRTWRLVRDADLVFGWFASMHLLVPLLCARVLRRPSAVVLGGYDVAAEPSLGYGHQLGGPRRLVARLVMRLATVLLPVSELNRRDAIEKAGAPPRKLRLVPNGVPVPPAPGPGPRRTVLTVGRVDESNLERKGLRAFVETAALLPDVPFVLVGGGDPAVIEPLRRTAPPNVVLTGQLSGQALVDRFTEAAVYVQASRYESFGLSVAEAMSYECIPVLTRLAALPEVGGEVAVYVEAPTAVALAEAVREAIELRSTDPARGAAARRRVEQHFELELRGQRLAGVLEELLG